MNAWLGFKENCHGRLAAGLAADIAILDRSIETSAPDRIGSIDISMTICDGTVTHDNGTL